jgi:uncharacterized OsmC-like protein
MSINAFDAAVAGESVLVTETRMEDLQLLGRVGGTSFVISLLGAALGSSTAMTLRLYADRVGLPLVRVQVSVSHHPSGADYGAAFERSIILEGDLSDEQRHELSQVARHCPVDQTLSHGAEIHTSVSTDMHISAAPATSDYLRDVDERVSALQESVSHTD